MCPSFAKAFRPVTSTHVCWAVRREDGRLHDRLPWVGRGGGRRGGAEGTPSTAVVVVEAVAWGDRAGLPPRGRPSPVGGHLERQVVGRGGEGRGRGLGVRGRGDVDAGNTLAALPKLRHAIAEPAAVPTSPLPLFLTRVTIREAGWRCALSRPCRAAAWAT